MKLGGEVAVKSCC